MIIRTTFFLFLSLCFITHFLPPSPANAKQCPSVGSPCEEYGEASAIFIGIVLSSEEARSGKNFVIKPETIFKGSTDSSITFFSCFECMYDWGYEFSVGAKYLIYAHQDSSGKWMASACGRTRPIAEANEDLEFLQNLPPEGSGGHLYGKFTGIDSSGTIPIAGAILAIEGQTHGYMTTTDTNGQYELISLSPGDYKVTFKVIEGAQEYEGYARSVRVYDRSCSQLNFLCLRDDAHRRYTYK